MIEFLYDGTLEGLFTAIFYAYSIKTECTIKKLKKDNYLLLKINIIVIIFNHLLFFVIVK